ncbi:MAG: endonuclease [Arthrobacter sp.]|nr:endonuclease [Arthrobacter sp.]
MLELKRIYWTRHLLRATVFCLTVWLFGSAILALLPNPADLAIGQRATTVAGILRQTFDGVLAAIAVPAVLIIALMAIAAIMRGRDLRRRDPVRRFTRQQRRQGMARAQGQCEMEDVFRRRCSSPAEHGDHFYPWSKGGATSLQNFVAACGRCNRAKGARIPSPSQQMRMERRRRGYVALEEAVLVGERVELP